MDRQEDRKSVVLDMNRRIPLTGTKSTGFFETSLASQMYWQKVVPATEIKGAVFYFHGYADHASWFIHDHMMNFVENGYLVIAVDYPGHGLSSGLHCYIKSFPNLVKQLQEFIVYHLKNTEMLDLPLFFVGESMGAMCATNVWNLLTKDGSTDLVKNLKGIVMIAPLCGLAPNAAPSPPMRAFLNILATLFPTKAWVPQAAMNDRAVKVPEVRQEALKNTLYYRGAPRCRTALELLVASENMAALAVKASFPLLICHGSDDIITNPSASQNFFEASPSTDKTMLLYDGVWHSMLSGEPKETSFRIYSDIFEWMNTRVEEGSQVSNRFDRVVIDSLPLSA